MCKISVTVSPWHNNHNIIEICMVIKRTSIAGNNMVKWPNSMAILPGYLVVVCKYYMDRELISVEIEFD